MKTIKGGVVDRLGKKYGHNPDNDKPISPDEWTGVVTNPRDYRKSNKKRKT